MSEKQPGRDRRPWYRSKGLLRSLLAVLLVVVVIAWQADAFTAKQPPGAVSDRRPGIGDAETVVVRRSMEPVARVLIGTIAARRKSELRARIAGQVERVAVEAGQRVDADDLLVELDRGVLQAGVDEASAALEIARAESRGARENFVRIEEAAAAEATPQTALIAARQARDAAEQMVEQRAAGLRAARTRLGYTRIAAPRAGVVVDPLVDPGDYVTPGRPVVELFDSDLLEVVVAVPASLADRLEVGQVLECAVGAIDRAFPGEVRAIVPRADPLTRTFRVELAIEPQPGLRLGMFARVTVPGIERETLQVPVTAVESLRQLDFVRHVDAEDLVNRRAVRVGRRFGDSIDILAGLRAGDRIIRDVADHDWAGAR